MNISHRLRLPADQTQRGLTAALIEGSLFSVWAGAVNGNYLTGAAILLGASGLALGILGALPAMATMLQMLAAPLVLGRGRPRATMFLFAGLQRFAAALAGPVALTFFPGPLAIPVFLALHVFAWACMAPGTVVWQGYMTDLVPARVRGEYFSRRTIWGAVAGITTVLLYGAILDRIPGTPGFVVVWALALVAAALDTASWFLHPDLDSGEQRSGRSFLDTMRVPLTRPGPHRTASFFLAGWAFAQGLAAPFYAVALVKMLHLSFGSVSVLATVASVASILSARFWGRWIDRVGHGGPLGVATGMAALVPVTLLSASIGGWPLMIAAYVLNGVASVGYGVSTQTLNMGLAPREDRASYFAFFATAGGITGFLTPILAGPFTERHLPLLFIAGSALSAVMCLVWLLRVRHLVSVRPEPF